MKQFLKRIFLTKKNSIYDIHKGLSSPNVRNFTHTYSYNIECQLFPNPLFPKSRRHLWMLPTSYGTIHIVRTHFRVNGVRQKPTILRIEWTVA